MTHLKSFALTLFAACAASLSAHSAALAGQACSEKQLTTESLRLGTNTAVNVQRALDASKARVAMIARVGMDLSEYKIRYTHAGLAYRDKPSEPWRIAHLLNGCNTASSDLWIEGLGNFFLDDLHAYEAILMLPPSADVEQRLLKSLTSPAAIRAVHNPAYNMVAYPFSLKYQNSNAWVLETLAVALSTDTAITNRSQAQAWLKLAGYEPSEMRIPAHKRLGARMFKANVAFDDHPNEQRYADRIQTVTVDSLVNFLEKRPAKWRKMIVDQVASATQPVAAQAFLSPPVATRPQPTAPANPRAPASADTGRFSVYYDDGSGKLIPVGQESSTPSPVTAQGPVRPSPAATQSTVAPAISAPPQLSPEELREAHATAVSMFALFCMSSYPETRPAILKRFRQDVEEVGGKTIANKVLNNLPFEETLKQVLANSEPNTLSFSDPFYPICSNFNPETLLADDEPKEKAKAQADERLQYAYEILEQCKKRYPNRTLGAAADRQKELDSYFGPRKGAFAFNDSGYSDWIKGSVKNPVAIINAAEARIKQHGELGWQQRCKPQ
jgi:hypothetical protein